MKGLIAVPSTQAAEFEVYENYALEITTNGHGFSKHLDVKIRDIINRPGVAEHFEVTLFLCCLYLRVTRLVLLDIPYLEPGHESLPDHATERPQEIFILSCPAGNFSKYIFIVYYALFSQFS